MYTDACTRKQVALLPLHAHTHAHTFAPSLQVISGSAVCTPLPRWRLGHPGCSRSHGTAAARQTRAKRSVQETLHCPGHGSLGCFSGETGRAQSEVHGPRHLGTKWLLRCQWAPGRWPSPSEVLKWTSSPWRTLWASSTPGLRMAQGGPLPEALGDAY